LNLAGNKIGTADILSLDYTYLECLNISNNKISVIRFVNLPKLLELDISSNNFNKFPTSVLKSIPNLKFLNISNNNNIGTFNDFVELGFLDSINLSSTKININTEELINLRFALPNTTLVFSTDVVGKVAVSKKIEPGKIEELKPLKSGWESNDFMSTIKLGEYFIDKNDIAFGDFIFTKLVNNYPEQNFTTTLAIADYLDYHELLFLSDRLYTIIVNNHQQIDFKSCFSLSKKLYSHHNTLDKKMLKRVMIHDSLNYYLGNDLFRIEYTSLLFNCNFKKEAGEQFMIIYDSLDKSDDHLVFETAKFFGKSNCTQFAIKLYETLMQSQQYQSQEKKFYGELCIVDLMSDNEAYRDSLIYLRYDNLCFRDVESGISKKIARQACESAINSYQQEISALAEKNKTNLLSAKKQVKRGSANKSIGSIFNYGTDLVGSYTGVNIDESAKLLLNSTFILGGELFNSLGDSQQATANFLMNDANTLEEKIQYINKRKAEIKTRIENLNQ
jgi:hypothetical protein